MMATRATETNGLKANFGWNWKHQADLGQDKRVFGLMMQRLVLWDNVRILLLTLSRYLGMHSMFTRSIWIPSHSTSTMDTRWTRKRMLWWESIAWVTVASQMTRPMDTMKSFEKRKNWKELWYDARKGYCFPQLILWPLFCFDIGSSR